MAAVCVFDEEGAVDTEREVSARGSSRWGGAALLLASLRGKCVVEGLVMVTYGVVLTEGALLKKTDSTGEEKPDILAAKLLMLLQWWWWWWCWW